MKTIGICFAFRVDENFNEGKNISDVFYQTYFNKFFNKTFKL